jgi:uncharacterized membrane protein (DUF4010 family)
VDLSAISFDEDGWRLAIALGVGLLLGVERERNKGTGPHRAPAGIRTFALVALLGGISMVIGNYAVLAIALGFVAAAALIAYALGDRTDPGLTTEVALLVAFLLGALAIEQPQLASGLAVAVAILLATRRQLHRFANQLLTEQEVHDGLLFAAAALVVLPLVPNEPLGPYDAFNPFVVWRLVVIVMAIGAVGYIAVRTLGARMGLPVAGFASGFVSSSATIAAMGSRAKREPSLMRAAVAGGVLSNVATVLQAVIIVGAINRATLREILPAMALAGIVAVIYGVLFSLRAARETGDEPHTASGRAFEPKTAILFALTITVVLFVSAALNDWLGRSGVTISAAAAGFADAHSPMVGVTSLVSGGRLAASDGALAIMAAFTTNSVTKCVLAYTAGGRIFARDLIPGVLAVLAAAWIGLLGWAAIAG